MIADYQLSHGEWNSQTLPSTIVLAARDRQLHDKETVENLLEESKTILKQLNDEKIITLMREAYDDLLEKYQVRSNI